MTLSDTKCRHAKPCDKPFRLHDGQGLYLEIRPSGSKLWRMKYRHGGRGRLQALGKYPAVTLEQARRRVLESRALLADGIDPIEAKQEEKSQIDAATLFTFEAVSREWFDGKLST